MIRRILLAAIALTACSDGEPPGSDASPGANDLVAVGKCSFGGATRSTIEPGDVYLYVVADSAGDFYVVTQTAGRSEPLTMRTLVQPVKPLLPARRTGDTRFDFGDEGHFIGLQWGGEIHTAVGTTSYSANAYPQCAAWNVESP